MWTLEIHLPRNKMQRDSADQRYGKQEINRETNGRKVRQASTVWNGIQKKVFYDSDGLLYSTLFLTTAR